MSSVRLDRWLPAVLVVAAGGAVVVMNWVSGDRGFAVVFLAFFGVVGWWSWPGRQGRHTAHVDAQRDADDDDLIVYWRPG